MADGTPNPLPPDNDWFGILYFFLITAITVGAEYLRRIMPPPRKNRRKGDNPNSKEPVE